MQLTLALGCLQSPVGVALYKKRLPHGRITMFASPDVPRRFQIYDSALCTACLAPLGETDDGVERLPAQLIPVNEDVYVEYLCTECFTNLPIKTLVAQIERYLSSEDGLFKEQERGWRSGKFFYDPFRFLEDSVKFLRGESTVPPFPCATFALHDFCPEQSIGIIQRGHLTLISFD